MSPKTGPSQTSGRSQLQQMPAWGRGKRLAEQKVIAALLGLPLDEVIRRAERARKKLSLIRNSIIAALLLLTLASVGGFT
jgi:hypothetical protein